MLVRCPECLQSLEFSADTTFREITCPSCGSGFDLVGEETETFKDESATVGHFELKKQLGRGAFGTVWLARDAELDRDVAIKTPRDGQLSVEEKERFLREARAAAQLKHPNIVGVHEVGRDGDSVYIVSEYVEGLSLADWLVGQQPTARDSATLCAKLAAGLQHAHDEGIVHRDLKPGNIMLDADGEPRILDFGLAKRDVREVTLTREGLILGTPAYMSPEQAKGEGSSADRRADVYSLGVVLFQLLTGELPFRGNVRMLVHQIINDDPPSPRKLNARIPKDLETICLRCIQKNPARRYQTAADVAADLRRWLNGEPITARPIGRIERSILWCRRNKAVSAFAFLAVSLLIGIASITTTAYLREVEFREDIQDALGRESNALVEAKDALTAAEAAERATRLQLYVADMSRAADAYESGVHGLLQQILHAHVPGPGEPDNRGFEWYYWQNRSQEYEWRVEGVPEATKAATEQAPATYSSHAYYHSPANYDWIAVFPEDVGVFVTRRYSDALSGIGIRNPQTGAFGGRFAIPSDEIDEAIRVDASPAGGLLAVVSRNDRLCLCDVNSRTIHKSFDAMITDVMMTCFSDDGVLLAACSRDGSVLVYDIDKDTEVCSFHVNAEHDANETGEYPYHIAFSPSGKLLAVCMKHSEQIEIWDATTGQQVSTINDDGNAVAAFTNRDDRLISTGNRGELRYWDLTGPNLISTVKVPNESRIRSLTVSPDRSEFAAGTSDRRVHVWNCDSLEKKATFRGHSLVVVTLKYSRDGRFLYSGSSKELVKWDLQKTTDSTLFERAVSSNPAHIKMAISVDNSELVLSGSPVQILNIDDARQTRLITPADWVNDISFSPTTHSLFAGGRQYVQIWEREDRESKVSFEVPQRIKQQAISPDGNWLVAGGGERRVEDHHGYVLFVDLTSENQWQVAHQGGEVRDIEFIDSERFLTVSWRPGSIDIWNLKERKIDVSRPSPQLSAAAISPVGDVAAIGRNSGKIDVLKLDSLELLFTLPLTGQSVHDLEFLAGGKTLAVADDTPDVKLWNLQSRQLVGALPGHQTNVIDLCTADNPPRLFSLSKDGEIRIWRGGPDTSGSGNRKGME